MQGRPCAIDPDYCDLQLPTAEDFPDPSSPKTGIFINWVSLCEIVGRIGKAIAQRKIPDLRSAPTKDLIGWVQDLPPHLQLPISADRTTNFNREVHLLHLPYLAIITLLYLRRSTTKMPIASATAIVAASCIARIFEDLLGRGTLRFMPGQAGWYIVVSLLALLHARRIPVLTIHADSHIAVLRTALKQMANMWHSAKMFYAGLEKIPGFDAGQITQNAQSAAMATNRKNLNLPHEEPQSSLTLEDVSDDVSWADCFPYVTMRTSPLVSILLANTFSLAFSEMDSSRFTYLFDYLEDLDTDALQMNLDF